MGKFPSMRPCLGGILSSPVQPLGELPTAGQGRGSQRQSPPRVFLPCYQCASLVSSNWVPGLASTPVCLDMGFLTDEAPEKVPVPLAMVGTLCPDFLPWELGERGLFLGHPAWVGSDGLCGDAC